MGNPSIFSHTLQGSEDYERAKSLVRGLFRGRQKLSSEQFARITGIRSKYLSSSLINGITGEAESDITQKNLARFFALLDSHSSVEKAKAAFMVLSAGYPAIDRQHFSRLLDKTLKVPEKETREEICAELVNTLFNRQQGQGDAIHFNRFARIMAPLEEFSEQLHTDEVSWLQQLTQRASSGKIFKTVRSFLFKRWNTIVWAGLYAALCASLFAMQMQAYAALGKDVAIQLARASAICLNLTSALILLPMLKGIVGSLQRRTHSQLLHFDAIRQFHQMMGMALVLFSIAHIGGHVVHNVMAGNSLIHLFFQTHIGITGFILTITIGCMAYFARERFYHQPKRYATFKMAHRLYFIWFAVLLLHSKHFWVWFIAPCILYMWNFAWKNIRNSHLSCITALHVQPSDTTVVHLRRPAGFQFCAGDYLYIRIPELDRMQWHPFTISSSPEQDVLTLHIRGIGYWTRMLHDMAVLANEQPMLLPAEIDGPYPSPCAHALQDNVTVLVAGGIGITPFASILQHIAMRQSQGHSIVKEKLYVYWVGKSHEIVTWIGDILRQVQDAYPATKVDVAIYCTAVQRDLSHLALQLATEHYYHCHSVDILTGLRYRIRWGRPNWAKELTKIKNSHEGQVVKVFFCGPRPFASELRNHCYKQGMWFSQDIF